jgi:hypothetical protein
MDHTLDLHPPVVVVVFFLVVVVVLLGVFLEIFDQVDPVA